MIVCAEILSVEAASELRSQLAQAEFVDGRVTAGWSARHVKNNLQAKAGDARAVAIADALTATLSANSVFEAVALPRRLTPLIISQTKAGMSYGLHMDDALMGDPPLRTDLALTIFLSGPDEYEGGSLVIEGPFGEQQYRLPAGTAVIYPATYLHRVEPVTRGSRLAAVGWVQSLVRRDSHRELLFDLHRARQSIFAKQGKSADFDLLARCFGNLMREWSEP